MALDQQTRAAIKRYGPSVNKYSRQRYGISGQALLAKLTTGESGGNRNAVSSAGARGLTQFMPATRQAYIQRYGVDPWKNPDQAEHATALYLASAKGDLQAYNPGMPTYTKYILGQQVKVSGGGPAPASKPPAAKTPAAEAAPTAGGMANLQPLLQQYLSNRNQPDAIRNLGLGLPGAVSADASAPSPGRYGPKPIKAPKAGTGPTKLAAGGTSSSGAYPLGRRGKVIGTPFSGTHAKAFNQAGGSDNWQSENAIDISIPVGTPVYAVADGVLGNTGSLGQGGRFAGLRTNLVGKGNSWYYAHLSKLVVKQGERVRKGQLLGYSGSANGSPHLHFAQAKGDPRKFAGRQ